MGVYEDLTLILNKILARLDEQDKKIEELRRALADHQSEYIHDMHFDY